MPRQNTSKIGELLRGQNPWWGFRVATTAGPLALPTHPRFARRRLLETATRRVRLPGLLVYGPRRTGKTTLLRQCAWDVVTTEGFPPSKVLLADFEHPHLWDVDLDTLMAAHRLLHGHDPRVLLLDEVQRLDHWDSWLKVLADHASTTSFIATGSAAIPLLQGSRESGPGRWDELELPPLLFSEYLEMEEPRHGQLTPSGISLRAVAEQRQGPRREDLVRSGVALGGHFRAFVVRGGFPEAVNQASVDQAQRIMREEVVARAVGRDIAREIGAGRVDDVERMFTFLAETTGQLINETDIGRMLGVSRDTVRKYLGYLERAGLIWRLGRQAGPKGAVKAQRKGYLADASLAAAALWQGSSVFERPERLGALAETAVAAHLRAVASYEGGRVRYFRDRQRREVDFLVELPGAPPLAVEVKYQSTFRRSFVEGLLALRRAYPEARPVLVVPADVAASEPPAPEGVVTWAIELFVAGLGIQLQLEQQSRSEEQSP